MATLGMRTCDGLALLLCLAAATARGEGGYKVVVHPDSSLVSISRNELSAVFLKRRTEWPDGGKALPVDQPEGTPVREAFSRDVHGRKATAVKSHWLQVVFSGRGVPPPEKESDQAVIAYVRAKPGAIGYVSASARTDDVKVLGVQP